MVGNQKLFKNGKGSRNRPASLIVWKSLKLRLTNGMPFPNWLAKNDDTLNEIKDHTNVDAIDNDSKRGKNGAREQALVPGLAVF